MKKIIFFAVFIFTAVSAFTQNNWAEKDTFDRITGLTISKPAFTDLDNDGLLDLIIGESDGNLNHYEQNAQNSTEFDLVAYKFNKIVGNWSAPAFTDLDNDGLSDLIIGEYAGYLNHYEQNAVNSTEFGLVNENLKNILSGSNFKPVITDLDNDGKLDLITANNSGRLIHFEQTEVDADEFELIDHYFNSIDVGWNSALTFIDLDNDGLLDLIIGESEGKLHHYEQNAQNSTEFDLVAYKFNKIVGNWSAPAFTDLDNDGLLDLIIGEYHGNLNHYEQNAVNSNEFDLVTDKFNKIDAGRYSAPAFTDLDNDGLLDLIIGEQDGNLNHYEQNAANSTGFTLVTENLNNINVGNNAKPVFTDLDNDGMLDLVIGNEAGELKHYEQMSENLPVQFSSFTAMQTSVNSVEIGWVTQTENDMRGFYVLKSETEDLASASRFSDLIPASNTVSAHEYVCEDKEVEPNKRYWYWIEALSMSDNSTVTASQSVVLREFEDPEEEVPEFALETGLADVYPNPFNPPVNISFFMDEESVEQNEKAEIMIYNVKGQEVHRRDLGIKSASGMYTISWNGNDKEGKECGSGIYFVKFTAGEHSSFKKSIKLK